MAKSQLRSHQELTEALQLCYNFGEAIRQYKLKVPKKFRALNIKTATWCRQQLHIFNKHNKHLGEVLNFCDRYVIIYTSIKKQAQVT